MLFTKYLPTFQGKAGTAAKAGGDVTPNGPSGVVNEAEVARLTEEVTKQVRGL